jgi:hypothetical protein
MLLFYFLRSRKHALKKIREWWQRITEQVEDLSDAEHGDFISNEMPVNVSTYDPTIYRYSENVDPTFGAIYAYDDSESVRVHHPPPFAQSISQVWRQPFCDPKLTACPAPKSVSRRVANQGTDSMCVFEGKTGMLVDDLARYPGVVSPMGIVVMRRNVITNSYDLFIAFRGTRSGSTKRVPSLQNPDWITNLHHSSWEPVPFPSFQPLQQFCPHGNQGSCYHNHTFRLVHRGFDSVMNNTERAVFGCVQTLTSSFINGPERIWYLCRHVFISSIL